MQHRLSRYNQWELPIYRLTQWTFTLFIGSITRLKTGKYIKTLYDYHNECSAICTIGTCSTVSVYIIKKIKSFTNHYKTRSISHLFKYCTYISQSLMFVLNTPRCL